MGLAVERSRWAVVGSGSRFPESCLILRPVVPAVSSQNGGGLLENMAACGTFSPGRLWGCSSVPGTVSPWGCLSLHSAGEWPGSRCV